MMQGQPELLLSLSSYLVSLQPPYLIPAMPAEHWVDRLPWGPIF